MNALQTIQNEITQYQDSEMKLVMQLQELRIRKEELVRVEGLMREANGVVMAPEVANIDPYVVQSAVKPMKIGEAILEYAREVGGEFRVAEVESFLKRMEKAGRLQSQSGNIRNMIYVTLARLVNTKQLKKHTDGTYSAA